MLLLALLFRTGDTGGMTGEERRIAQTLSCVQGAGKVRVTLYSAQPGTAFGGGAQTSGALVVAQGATDVRVRLRLTEAVETLLGLPPGSVLVLEMEERE